MGYIPAVPDQSIDWFSGGTSHITNAINNGTFMIVHYDHGYEDGSGWWRPYFTNGNISSLSNTNNLCYLISVDCSSGKYANNESFTERMYRHGNMADPKGSLGGAAASAVAYDWHSEVFSWGMYDHFWPDFITNSNSFEFKRDLLPGFALASAKIFVQQNPFLSYNYLAVLTNNINHHHGDAFLRLYDSIPQSLSLIHNSYLPEGQTSFDVLSDTGIRLTVSVNGEIISSVTSSETITSFVYPDTLSAGNKLTLTGWGPKNTKLYRNQISILDSSNAFLPLRNSYVLHDTGLNANGLADYSESINLELSLQNVGGATLDSCLIRLVSTDTTITVLTDSIWLTNIQPFSSIASNPVFDLTISPFAINNTPVTLNTYYYFEDQFYMDSIQLTIGAPDLYLETFSRLVEKSGDYDGVYEKGELGSYTIAIGNNSRSMVTGSLLSLGLSDAYFSVNDATILIDTIYSYIKQPITIEVSSLESIPDNHIALLYTNLNTFHNQIHDTLQIYIPGAPLVIDLDNNKNSCTAIHNSLLSSGFNSNYVTQLSSSVLTASIAFVCLGSDPNAYRLTAADGNLLADYLINHNGSLYMEGGDTWYYDPAVAVHPLFNIIGITDGANNDLQQIYSVNDSVIYPQLSYNYTGDNRYMDRLAPGSGAIELLRNTKGSVTFATAIFYDGGTYRTIGASHEFGGLAESSNNRNQLMAEYLHLLSYKSLSTWLGHTNEWFDKQNWSSNRVPDYKSIIVIPGNPVGGLMPASFNQSSISGFNLILETGAVIILPEGIQLELK